MQRSPSATVSVSGFSTKTCFPAAKAASVIGACVECGVATKTASTRSSARISSRDGASAQPYSAANEARASGLRA